MARTRKSLKVPLAYDAKMRLDRAEINLQVVLTSVVHMGEGDNLVNKVRAAWEATKKAVRALDAAHAAGRMKIKNED